MLVPSADPIFETFFYTTGPSLSSVGSIRNYLYRTILLRLEKIVTRFRTTSVGVIIIGFRVWCLDTVSARTGTTADRPPTWSFLPRKGREWPP